MSPEKMFHNCGSSSIAVARSRRPIRVIRGSFSVAWTGPVRASASGTLHRNLRGRNTPAPPPADAILTVRGRPAILELDRERHQSPQRGRHDETGASQQTVE